MQKLVLLFGAMTAALGCHTEPSLGVLGNQRQSIIGGSAASLNQFPTVVAVLNNGICTGTLISPTVVLTAAHCIDPDVLGLANQQAVTNSTIIAFDTLDVNNLNGNNIIEAADTIPHPNFNVQALGDNDIGVVLLAEPATGRPVSPIEQNAARNLIGAPVTQVGYGVRTPGDQSSAGRLFFLGNQTVDNCDNLIGPGFNGLLLCFDQNETGQIRGSCSGDSGGPALDSNGVIVGVTSFGDQNCAQFAGYTKVGAEADFVLPFLDGGLDCDADGVCTAGCGNTDPDCDPGPLDCGADNTCTAGCGANGNPADPDCLDCSGDNICEAGCGADGNPDDPDCETCGADNACNELCGQAGNPADPDCQDEAPAAGRCAVDPGPSSQGGTFALLFSLAGLVGLALRAARKR